MLKRRDLRATCQRLPADVSIVGHGIDLMNFAAMRRWIDDPPNSRVAHLPGKSVPSPAASVETRKRTLPALKLSAAHETR